MTVILKQIERRGDAAENEVAMLGGAEPRKILQIAVSTRNPAIMSYMSRGKWHASQVLVTDVGANTFNIEVSPRKESHPINIQVGQQVGVSFKHGYGKFIFEATVMGFQASPNSHGGGTVSLSCPASIQMVQRRNYFRVEVPRGLKVDVILRRRGHKNSDRDQSCEHHWKGKLVDISAGGAQIVLDSGQSPNIRKGQFIELQFTPMPYEKPLMFDGQIRSILPTADEKNICVGLQAVGLETSAQGRNTLQRLCNVVEQYHQANQSSAKHMDFKTTGY